MTGLCVLRSSCIQRWPCGQSSARFGADATHLRAGTLPGTLIAMVDIGAGSGYLVP
ncbi:MAG: hypothetical protein ACR2KT_15615 [Methylocella sp.]